MHADFTLSCAAWSWVGHERSGNEDAIGVWDVQLTAALADGMGGHAGGAEASRLAIKTVETGLPPASERPTDVRSGLDWAAEIVLAAHHVVQDSARNDPTLAQMGTTLIVARQCRDGMVFGHVGDSRVYRWEAGGLTQITRDHTLVQSLIDQGVVVDMEAAIAGGLPSHVLVQAVGVDPEPEPDLLFEPWDTATAWLICSDGLTAALSEKQIAGELGSNGDSLEVAAARLAASVRTGYAEDNVSFVLIRANGKQPSEENEHVDGAQSQGIRPEGSDG